MSSRRNFLRTLLGAAAAAPVAAKVLQQPSAPAPAVIPTERTAAPNGFAAVTYGMNCVWQYGTICEDGQMRHFEYPLYFPPGSSWPKVTL